MALIVDAGQQLGARFFGASCVLFPPHSEEGGTQRCPHPTRATPRHRNDVKPVSIQGLPSPTTAHQNTSNPRPRAARGLPTPIMAMVIMVATHDWPVPRPHLYRPGPQR